MSDSLPLARLVRRLLFVVVAMFAFGFALVPLYDVICDITGLNGKTQGRYETELAQSVQEDRQVTVQFTAMNNAGMDWEFRPSVSQLTVSPGEVHVISYRARNPHDYPMTGQAIPSVAPNAGAAHLNKIECFCFQEQILGPGEEVDMALRFFVDENLPDRISKIEAATGPARTTLSRHPHPPYLRHVRFFFPVADQQ